ncbi:MAG: MotA/TolQ/ExbB proton channel family protein [Proteobacteria bacterium]|nr:MotA/TolQ/ExbB proton channel family protein [Pseudomonadota bacterium]
MWELIKQGGVVMYPLGLCSLITVAILIERVWRFRDADRDPQTVVESARSALSRAGTDTAAWQDEPAPAVRVVGAAIGNRSAGRTAIEQHMEATLAAENLRLSSRLSVVGTIGNVSPFIGLFGTVLGIIRAFRDIGEVGAAGPAVVAAGISEALVATAAGLFVAITAVIVYNFLLTWQTRLSRRAEIVAGEVLNLVAPGA